MNEDAFNMEVRKFLKKVGITAQREIEQAVREALASGRIKGSQDLSARMTLSIEDLGLSYVIDGTIGLE